MLNRDIAGMVEATKYLKNDHSRNHLPPRNDKNTATHKVLETISRNTMMSLPKILFSSQNLESDGSGAARLTQGNFLQGHKLGDLRNTAKKVELSPNKSKESEGYKNFRST
jgi:hypothetical protein